MPFFSFLRDRAEGGAGAPPLLQSKKKKIVKIHKEREEKYNTKARNYYKHSLLINGLLKNFSRNIKPFIADKRFDVPNIIIETLALSRIYAVVKTLN